MGVEDSGSLQGIENDKNWEEWVMNIARTTVVPPVTVSYSQVEVNQKNIGVIKIEKGRNRPYQTNDGKYYVRVGSTNRTASIQELMPLFQ